MQQSNSEMIIEALQEMADQAPALIKTHQQKLRGQLEKVPDAAALKAQTKESWGSQYDAQG